MARQMRETAGIDTGPHRNTAQVSFYLASGRSAPSTRCKHDPNVRTGTLERAEITDDRGAFRVIRDALEVHGRPRAYGVRIL